MALAPWYASEPKQYGWVLVPKSTTPMVAHGGPSNDADVLPQNPRPELFCAPVAPSIEITSMPVETKRTGGAGGHRGIAFVGQVLDGFDAKGLRGAIDDIKQRIGSGIAAIVAVNDGRASVAVGVTTDLVARHDAVELLRRAVAALGGQGGGGRPDMAQGGGPDGTRAAAAIQTIRDALFD